MEARGGGGRRGRAGRWAVGVLCVLGVAMVCLAASQASAAAGDLDGTFGTGGKVTTDFAGNGDLANAVAVQPDGKIVAAGGALGTTVDFALARYRPDGTLDATFGIGGKVRTDFGSGEQAFAVAVQPDGKIVAAGGVNTEFELARYNPDGSLDGTFGAGGKVTTRFGLGLPFTVAHALVLQPDGKIVVAGTATPTTDWDFGLARYNPNGTLDATFGAGGKVTTDIGHLSTDLVWAVALQPDGKLVVAGSSTGPAGDAFALARYTPSGSLDGTFGSSGRVTTGFGGDQDWAQAVAVQPDGKIVAAGKTGNECCGGTFNFALARFNAGGTLDSAFGTGGKVTTDVAGGTDNAHALVIQADGKILAGGERLPGGNVSGASFDFALARYQPGGTLDPTFGTGGLVTTDFPGHNDHVYALALQQDGKVVAAGDSSPDFALARYATTTANNPPVASNDSYATAEDTPLTVPAPGVLANDSDADGDPLTAALVTGPAHGMLAMNADGSFAYTPAADFNGSDTFAYKASDGRVDSNAATVTISVTEVNDAPTAAADQATLAEDASTAIDVTANDVPGPANEASQALLVGSLTQPSHGQAANVTGGADAGKVSYTPAADYYGPDSFTYTVCDDGTTDAHADPKCDTARVDVTVTAANDAPAAQDDSYGGKGTAEEDTPFTAPAPGVLANDSDGDGDALTAQLVTGPAHGTVTLHPDGSFTYTPAANFNGRDFFTYKASDGDLTSNLATVSITVAPVNDAPVAQDDSYSTDQDAPLTVPAPGVLANDSDGDGDRLTAALVTGPAHGTLTLRFDGSFAYTPVAGFYGKDSFTYVARDSSPTGDGATVTITVVPPPGIPIARDDSYGTDQDTLLTVPAPGVLANDSDADGDRLSIAPRSVTGPAHGTLALNGNGSFTYRPAPGFNGQDSFTYKASDGARTSDVATVTITVAPKVLFTSTRDGNPEIYVMNADGTAPTRLTTNTATDANPVWSPNHQRIAFTSTRDGNAEIYVMNADGTVPTRLTISSLIDATPAWSPDGTRIAFARGSGSRWDIYAMKADGTAQTALTVNPAIDATPAWGPDGRIAFSSSRDGNAEIYVMPATGEAGCQVKACTIAKRLTINPAIDTSPTWLGTRIAFSSTRDDPNAEIYVMNADGTAPTRLTTNPASDATPAGSPDGQRIAFSSTRDDPNAEIYVMNADGTAPTRLTTNPASDAFPDW